MGLQVSEMGDLALLAAAFQILHRDAQLGVLARYQDGLHLDQIA
jgi:hypothetical protein